MKYIIKLLMPGGCTITHADDHAQAVELISSHLLSGALDPKPEVIRHAGERAEAAVQHSDEPLPVAVGYASMGRGKLQRWAWVGTLSTPIGQRQHG